MNVLLTGSSGWLGQHLMELLRSNGIKTIGLDPKPASTTHHVNDLEDKQHLRDLIHSNNIQTICHCGALHKPNIRTHSNQNFVETNIQGTLNLLELAVETGSPVRRFIFTSTTSLMISRKIRDGLTAGAKKAVWMDETIEPKPRNIYGVTKLAGENLCRMFHQSHQLPIVVLRTSRFFPEEDDQAHKIKQTGENTKVNELLFRRLDVQDAALAHLVALNKADKVGFGIYIVSAKTPFSPDDCQELVQNAPKVVEKYFPEYPRIYSKVGWTMFDAIDRVYDASKIERELGFVCQVDFASALEKLKHDES